MTIPGLRISIEWRKVILNSETSPSYIYPQKFTQYMRDKYSDAAVYRWEVCSPNGKLESVYIGQADQLLVRIQRVLTPPKTAKPGNTNKRLKDIFDSQTASGKNIHLAVLKFAPFDLEGISFVAEKLSDEYVRKALENICLCVAEAEGCELLNKKIEPVDRLVREFQRLPVHERRGLLRSLKAEKNDRGT